jgi:hypothetical protein
MNLDKIEDATATIVFHTDDLRAIAQALQELPATGDDRQVLHDALAAFFEATLPACCLQARMMDAGATFPAVLHDKPA